MTTKTETQKGLRQNSHYYSVRHSGAGCKTVITDPVRTFTVYDAFSRTRVGGPVPNFRTKIAMGVDASGDYSVDATTTHYGSGEVYTEWTNNSCQNKPRDSDTVTGTLDLPTFGAFSDFSSKVTTARNAASGRFWSAASEIESHGLVFLGELRETLHMLRHPLSGARKLYFDYHSRMRKNARKIRRFTPSQQAKYFGEQYLEYKFGWDPFVKDAQSIIEAAVRLSNDIEYKRLRSHSSAETSSAAAPVLVTLTNYGRLYRHQKVRQKVTVTCRGAYKLSRFVDSPLEAVASNLGLLPSGFVPAIWQLLPYSFIFDYFSNVGDVIASACVCKGNIAWSNTSQVIEESNVCTYQNAPNASLTSAILKGFQTGDHSPSYRERYRFSRSGGVPVPSFQASLPGLTPLVNLAALSLTKAETLNSLTR